MKISALPRSRALMLSILAVASLAFGCGDSGFEETGATLAPSNQPIAVDPLIAELGDGSPESVTPTGSANTAQALFTFAGTGNANLTPFAPLPSAIITAAFQPTSVQRTSLIVNIQNKPVQAGITRFLDLRVLDNSSKIEVGSRFSADSRKSGAKAQLVYGETPQASGKVKLFESRGGEVVVTQLTPGVGRSGSVRVRLENVQMAPRASAVNVATGSFQVNGEGSFTF